MQHEDTIRDIRRRCRMAMNGIASASMRNHGLSYKLNFGVDISKIKDIAARYTPDAELAELLWQDGTRELKILATLLYPVDGFTSEAANRWVAQIPNQEIREQVSLNLFQSLPFAGKLVKEWINNAGEDIRTSGYWLAVRLMLTKKQTEDICVETLSFVFDDAVSGQVSLRNAALLFLKNAGKQSPAEAEYIIKNLTKYKDSDDAVLREIYDSLSFEFEFYYDR
ncbi:DNA alkylation repair protein [Dysgonomonas macrotermitis]|uniref:3-methyladenine DNA glycosylase AlkD n=1 Tax=Dysgonomonas macrotermitis TaxID=1346286 RepID=A0A1M4ZJG4_9BACT|nr:DNA alkylation repair protein [Dysgonomonas macrotermitis]SHF18179.1 3-methyladenine DNA glycosylase AlkD [Dysgonomonas macrotermitis]